MLLPRVLTALVGIPLMLYLVHAGGVAYGLFVVAISTLCCYEYALMLRLGGRPVQFVLTVALGAALSACAALGGPLPAVLAGGVALVVLAEMAAKEHSLDRVALTLFGALFAGWLPAHLALIRDLRPHGEAFAFLTFAAVWAMDTAAYAAGRGFGRHALAPTLSPKKTWEGAIAGFAAAIAVSLAFQKFMLQDSLSPLMAVAIGALIGSMGQLSDLAESMVKREAGAKDSGALLPGHGGVFDRFDSYILCAPAVYYALSLR
ncbi:MAG: phosphatidate cytidylyltransferase [Elusimicrobiota bacterium]|nr:phosphatidate cytidylyltransferase [Elusimicrobiota bacterium]